MPLQGAEVQAALEAGGSRVGRRPQQGSLLLGSCCLALSDGLWAWGCSAAPSSWWFLQVSPLQVSPWGVPCPCPAFAPRPIQRLHFLGSLVPW